MTRRTLIVCLLLVCITGLQAQLTLSGKVTNIEGQALIGANVFINESMRGTVTNTSGEYALEKLSPGTYRVEVSYMGYQDVEKTITLNANQQMNFSLEEQPYLADEVVVYATRAQQHDPIAHDNIDKEELQASNTGNDIPYLLSVSPSVVATSEAGIGLGYTSFRIRGSDATRINVTMNGIPLNDAESQGVFWVNMPDFASSVDNVQIQRGVGTSTQGAGAFGATVNFQTEGLNSDPYAEYHLVGGSFNTMRNTIKLGSGLVGDHFSFDMRLSSLQTDGYIDYSFSDHNSKYFTGAYHAKNSLIRFTFLDGNERTGISWWGVPAEVIDTNRTYNPAGEYFDEEGRRQYYEDQTDNYKQTHYQLHFAQKLAQNLRLNMALHYTQGAGYYEQYMDDGNSYHASEFAAYGLAEIAVINGDTLDQTDLTRRKWLENDFFGFTTSLIYSAGRLNASLGGGWNRYDGDHFGNILWMQYNLGVPEGFEWYRNNGVKTDYNAYLKANYLLTEGLTVFGDLQYRHIDYTMSGTDDDLVGFNQEHNYDFINPKAGVFYRINSNNNVYLSGAIANREPTRANFKEAKGDPAATPKPERLYNVETGYQFTGTSFSANINFYYMHYHDQLVPTGEKSSVGYDIMTNVPVSYRRGIEISLAYKPIQKLEWNANVTLSQNKIEDFTEYATHYTVWNEDWQWYENEDYVATSLGKTDIAFSPSAVGSSILSYEVLEGAHITLISKYVGKQYFDNTSSEARSIDPYFVNNLRLNYSLPIDLFKGITLSFQINNLFNTEYISNGYGGNWYQGGQELTWAYYYPQAGIHFMGGINLRF